LKAGIFRAKAGKISAAAEKLRPFQTIVERNARQRGSIPVCPAFFLRLFSDILEKIRALCPLRSTKGVEQMEETSDQRRAPIYEALERFRQMRVVPFDVPGHKRGRGNPELTEFLGRQCVGVDVNSMKPLDNLCHPVSVIRDAERLAAEAFGAAQAFLMVGGTTSAVQSMVLTVCKRGDEIILPRNVHRSVINALVLCGAIPRYVNPEVDPRLGISLGMKREQVASGPSPSYPNAWPFW
jgi:hypothetical protein